MMPGSERIATLLFKYLRDELEPAERDELDSWVAASPENERTFNALTNQENIREKVIEMDRIKRLVKDKLLVKMPELSINLRPAPVRRMVWLKYAAAAAVVAMIAGAGYLMYNNGKPVKEIAKAAIPGGEDVLPGGNRAVLTLSNGATIILDSASNGVISQQGNTKVVKLEDGRIAYKGTGQDEVLSYNTITTRRGDQYQVVLPDGTAVWLNAASSLRYPTAFNDKERIVELTGEAYFEVASLYKKGSHDKVPFKVIINTPLEHGGGGEVNVLGTHFNINAYPDEAGVTTTLLEGAVRIVKKDVAAQLVPGQQVVLDNRGTLQMIKDASTEEAVAWKNGLFHFRGATIEAIMRQVSRWYNVDIVYEGKIAQAFDGEIPRDVPVSQLFKVLEATGRIKFRVAMNHSIIVMPVGNK